MPLADPKGDDRQITEKVNEMAVAKVLLEDEGITWPITYEPDLLPDGRKIDFVVDRGADNLYIEVKTVRPRTADTEAAWQKFIARREHHPDNVHFIVNKEWMGGAIYGNVFASRSHFLDYTMDFETPLAAAQAIKPGHGVLIFCGTGFAWHKSNLEDFADFYLTGTHRGDDAFALMEQHHIKQEKIKLLRNIGHFAFLRRQISASWRASRVPCQTCKCKRHSSGGQLQGFVRGATAEQGEATRWQHHPDDRAILRFDGYPEPARRVRPHEPARNGNHLPDGSDVGMVTNSLKFFLVSSGADFAICSWPSLLARPTRPSQHSASATGPKPDFVPRPRDALPQTSDIDRKTALADTGTTSWQTTARENKPRCDGRCVQSRYLATAAPFSQ
jgi:hypothetical protein